MNAQGTIVDSCSVVEKFVVVVFHRMEMTANFAPLFRMILYIKVLVAIIESAALLHNLLFDAIEICSQMCFPLFFENQALLRNASRPLRYQLLRYPQHLLVRDDGIWLP